MSKQIILAAVLMSSAEADPKIMTISPPRVPGGVHPIVHRQSADRYAVVGVGVLRTRGCHVTSPGIEGRIGRPDHRGLRWITFVDPVLGYEGECMVDDRPEAPPEVVRREPIRRAIAVAR